MFIFILGTNKSASLRMLVTEVEGIENENNDIESHTFVSGTMEGLMKAMHENNDSILGVFDEFSTLIDNIDKGSTGTSEKGRYLSLYSAVDWSKKTKASGNIHVKDPRLNIISFTQPFYAINFARNNIQDGFFQRFLVTVPIDVFKQLDLRLSYVGESRVLIHQFCFDPTEERFDKSIVIMIVNPCHALLQLMFPE